MAKDFFQDITPNDEPRSPRRTASTPPPVSSPVRDSMLDDDTEVDVSASANTPERSIRNINVNRQPRATMDRREVPPVGMGLPRPKKNRSTIWLWIIALVLLAVVGVLAIFLFRTTTVTVTPRAQTIVFDQVRSITAYPAATAATGTLTYVVQNFDAEDSEVVASQGTQHVERKSSGTVTVVNEYSKDPVKLVKNTRFQSPDGNIYRAPADITVPGMNGSAAGTINVTIVADEAGDKYNVGPTSRFTLPGLKGGAMFDKVYARSSTAFTGGFAGDEPGVPDSIKSSTIAAIRARLQAKILSDMQAQQNLGTMFPELAYVTFEDLPPAAEGANQVRVRQGIHVQMPVLPTNEFNRMLASTASADAENADLLLIPKEGFAVNIVSTSTTSYGQTPVSFSLAGAAQIVWKIDAVALANALAGKDQGAFQTVVNGFPSIQEARARVEPFWSRNFPADASKIQVTVKDPAEPANP